MDEVWLDVPGFEGTHQVSSEGRIRTVDRHILASRSASQYVFLKGMELTQEVTRCGYMRVALCRDGKGKRFSVHRLVALAFIGPCPDGLQVNHIDGNKANNCADNLEYVTASENIRHAFDTGLININSGTECYNAKLNEDIVAKIRRYPSTVTIKQIIEDLNLKVYPTVVQKARAGTTWKHVS